MTLQEVIDNDFKIGDKVYFVKPSYINPFNDIKDNDIGIGFLERIHITDNRYITFQIKDALGKFDPKESYYFIGKDKESLLKRILMDVQEVLTSKDLNIGDEVIYIDISGRFVNYIPAILTGVNIVSHLPLYEYTTDAKDLLEFIADASFCGCGFYGRYHKWFINKRQFDFQKIKELFESNKISITIAREDDEICETILKEI